MRITGLRIDRFGVWSDLTMDNLGEGMTVFFGPNEAGKSTLMQYIRTILYGFAPNRCERFLAKPRESGILLPDNRQPGGSLFIASRDSNYHVRRHADPMEPLESPGKVTVSTPDHGKQGPQQLATLLNGIDEAIYNNVFAVGLREVQRLASLDDTQAARQLYSLSTGTDRVSLVDVTRQLRSTKCRLVGCDDQPSLLTEFLQQQKQAATRIRQLGAQSARWAKLIRERDRIQSEISRLEAELTKTNQRAEVVESALRLQPKWETLRRLNVEIDSMGIVPEIPARLLETIGTLKNEIAAHQKRRDELQQRREQLQVETQQIRLNDALQRHSARIHAILDERTSIVTLDARVEKLKDELEEAEFEVQAEQERLGLAAMRPAKGSATGGFPKFDHATIATLQDPAHSLERDRQLLDAVKQEAAEYKQRVAKLGEEISTAMGHDPDWFRQQDADNVLRAMEQTSGAASGLRREMQVKQDINELTEDLQDIEDRRAGVLRNQLLPLEIVRALGVLFAMGSMLLLSGLFGDWLGIPETRRATLLLMGVIGTAVATLLKLVLDVPVRDGLRDTQRQYELLQQQLTDSETELDELNARNATLPGNPSGKRTGPISLRDTETRLVRLEGLLPLEHQRRGMLKLADEAERRAMEIAKSMKETRQRWEQTLTSLGLSTRMTPEQIRSLSADSNGLLQLYRVAEERRKRYEEARSEQAIVAERLRDLMADALIRPVSDKPSDKLNQLAMAMTEQDQLSGKQQSLRKKERELNRELQNVGRTIQQLQRRRTSQITMAGAADDDDLSRLNQRRRKYLQLINQRNTLQSQIDTALGNGAREKVLQRQLNSRQAQHLPDRLQRVQSDLEQAAARLKELQYRNGEITEQIRSLASDQSLGRAHLQLGLIQHQTDEGIHKWKVVDAFGSLLASVYKKYEKDRQPDTLKEASRYLSRMTNGRYQRIWTPLAEDVLIVEDHDGRQLPIEVLSRGTREQLFLSLRLALVAGYARRGVQMPVILDDVLVNFDSERTQSAAKVIADFARSGHQVLVFTCHQHIKDIFANLQVDVRDIPRRNAGTSEKVALHELADETHLASNPIVEVTNTIARMPNSLIEVTPARAEPSDEPAAIPAEQVAPAGVFIGFDEPVHVGGRSTSWATESYSGELKGNSDELLGTHIPARNASVHGFADAPPVSNELPRDYYRQWDDPPIRSGADIEMDEYRGVPIALDPIEPVDAPSHPEPICDASESIGASIPASNQPRENFAPVVSGGIPPEPFTFRESYSDYAEPVIDEDLLGGASVKSSISASLETTAHSLEKTAQASQPARPLEQPLGFDGENQRDFDEIPLVGGTLPQPANDESEESPPQVSSSSKPDNILEPHDFSKGLLENGNPAKNRRQNIAPEPTSPVKEPIEFDDVLDIDLRIGDSSNPDPVASDTRETTMTFDPTHDDLTNDDVVASTASGEAVLDEEYEYEYVDDATDGDDEYEYIEVEVDEDGNEMLAEDDSEEYDDEEDDEQVGELDDGEDDYEYVEVDDEDADEYDEVAEKEDDENEDDEYEYVDSEEDELDDEYEYVEVEVDEDGNEIDAEADDEYEYEDAEEEDYEIDDDLDAPIGDAA